MRQSQQDIAYKFTKLSYNYNPLGTTVQAFSPSLTYHRLKYCTIIKSSQSLQRSSSIEMLHQIRRLHVCKLFTESPRDVAQACSLVGSDVTEFSKGAEGTPHEVEVEERKLEEVDDVDRRETAQVLQQEETLKHLINKTCSRIDMNERIVPPDM